MPVVRITKAEMWRRIKKKCLGCAGFARKEIEYCTVEDCPLFELRMGARFFPCGDRTPQVEHPSGTKR